MKAKDLFLSTKTNQINEIIELPQFIYTT